LTSVNFFLCAQICYSRALKAGAYESEVEKADLERTVRTGRAYEKMLEEHIKRYGLQPEPHAVRAYIIFNRLW